MTDHNPLPGMNPWLESHWGDVHASLTLYARDALRGVLPRSLRARVEEYLAVEEVDRQRLTTRRVSPDVQVVEPMCLTSSVSGGVAVAAPHSVLTQPIRIRRLPIPTLRRLRITDGQDGGRLVTSIEFLSPANKVGELGRRQYLDKRQEMLAAGVNVVEVDLQRRGRWIVNVRRDSHAAFDQTPYVVCVTRDDRPDEAEVYPASYRQRLPVIAIPLRASDEDVLLEMQPLVDAAFVAGSYGDQFDYARQPTPRLSAADLGWVTGYLERAKLGDSSGSST